MSSQLALGAARDGPVRSRGRAIIHFFTQEELQIILAPLNSPHRTRAAQALCELLNETATAFPGNRLRLRFPVRSAPLIGLALSGAPAHRSAPNAAPAS